MNSHVFLHSGYYWSAGKEFGWHTDDPGVGIALKKIKDALPYDRVFVKSKYDILSIRADVAITEVRKFRAYKTVSGTKLGVIRKSRFVKENKKTSWQSDKRKRELEEMETQGQGRLV